MFNLIKMNLFRLVRTKSFYVVFMILAVFAGIMLMMVNEYASDQEMLELAFTNGKEGINLLFLMNNFFEGGLATLVISIGVCMFVCTDYSSGYIKNIASSVTRKSSIAFANFITWVIGTFIYYVGLTIVVFVFGNLILGSVSLGNVSELITYLAMSYFMLMVIVASMILATSFFRSSAACITLAVVLLQFGPLIYDAIQSFTGVDISEYSIITNVSSISSHYSGDWNTLLISGVIFMAVYLIGSAVIMEKKDI